MEVDDAACDSEGPIGFDLVDAAGDFFLFADDDIDDCDGGDEGTFDCGTSAAGP